MVADRETIMVLLHRKLIIIVYKFKFNNNSTTMIQELKNEIQDKKVYIDSILAHATNLDNELKKNIEIGMSNHLDMGERVEELEKINEKCTQLYNETLEKMDALLVENLNFKKKI